MTVRHGAGASRWLAVLAVAYVVTILCLRLWASAYTSGDDGYTTFAALNPNGIWSAAEEMAHFQGRFYQLFVYPLAMLPFIHGSLNEIAAWKVFTFLFMTGGIASLLFAIFGRWQALLGCILLLLLFDTVGGSYNPFHGLPLWFGVGCGALAASLACHVWHVRKQSAAWGVAAVALYLLALLTYEIVILYAPLYVLIAWYCDPARQGVIDAGSVRRIVKSVTGVVIVSVAYLVAYLAYRHVHPGTYAGAGELDISAPGRTLKPIIEFSLHGLYWSTSYSGAKGVTIQAISVLVALAIASWLAWRGMPRAQDCATQPTGSRLFAERAFVALVVAGYVFVPNILFGLTERYRVWAGDGVQFYLGSVHSAVAIIILLCLLAGAMRRASNPLVANWLALLLLIPLLWFGYANHRNSQNFFAQSEVMRSRWAVADWASAEINNAASQGSVPATGITVCGNGFTETRELPTYFRNADMIADADLFWSRYFSWKMKRGVTYKSASATTPNTTCDARLELNYGSEAARLSVANRTWTARIHNAPSIAW